MKTSHIVLLVAGMAAFFVVASYTMVRAFDLPIPFPFVAIMPATFLITFLPAALQTMRRKNSSGPP